MQTWANRDGENERILYLFILDSSAAITNFPTSLNLRSVFCDRCTSLSTHNPRIRVCFLELFDALTTQVCMHDIQNLQIFHRLEMLDRFVRDVGATEIQFVQVEFDQGGDGLVRNPALSSEAH